ncbi:MAG: MOSC domain-containing protein [Rhodothermales bacterium]
MPHVTALYIAPTAGAPMQSMDHVEAVAGQGLVGDRYFAGVGSFSRWPGSHREVSVIAEEDLEAMAEAGVPLTAAESRRNIVVRGLHLLDTLKQSLYIGEVELLVMRKCQPCKYLARLTNHPDLIPAMIDRGGIRARIITGGTIRIGDEVVTSVKGALHL